MSTKSVCNKENIRTKKYVPASDDIDGTVNKIAQCQSPVLGEDKQLPDLNKCDEGSENESTNNDKKKFVEAPLPKTNPWTANKNAAHIVRSKESVKEKDPTVGEKRILLPQQQTSCEYFLYLGILLNLILKEYY
jgi:hypothetical protein